MYMTAPDRNMLLMMMTTVREKGGGGVMMQGWRSHAQKELDGEITSVSKNTIDKGARSEACNIKT